MYSKITTLFNRNSSGYTVLFSNSKGGESAGTLANLGTSNTSIARKGESAGTLAGIFGGGSPTSTFSSSCSSSCTFIG